MDWVHCPVGNATEPIWRALASSQGISTWTPLKPQNSNPNTNPLPNQLWCIDFLTPPTPHIIPHRLPWISYASQKLMLDSYKMLQKQSEAFHAFYVASFFPSLKENFIAYRSSKLSHCIFEIHLLWQSGFIRVYFNSWCSCSFESEIIKISQSSHKMYRNNILNFQECTAILKASSKTSGNLLNAPHTTVRYLYRCPYNYHQKKDMASKQIWTECSLARSRPFSLATKCVTSFSTDRRCLLADKIL